MPYQLLVSLNLDFLGFRIRKCPTNFNTNVRVHRADGQKVCPSLAMPGTKPGYGQVRGDLQALGVRESFSLSESAPVSYTHPDFLCYSRDIGAQPRFDYFLSMPIVETE